MNRKRSLARTTSLLTLSLSILALCVDTWPTRGAEPQPQSDSL